MVSIDMNGLKDINDGSGHTAGDKAIRTVAACISRALKRKQLCYRLGGDEFVILCRQASKSRVVQLVDDIKKNTAATQYSCSIGYSHAEDGAASVGDLVQKSDEMMYADKKKYYELTGKDRRGRR